MPEITVVGRYADGSGQFSETVQAEGAGEAAHEVRRLLAPREVIVAGFFEYAPLRPGSPNDEVPGADDSDGPGS